MIADFFTKPLQGALFKKFREVIMGYVPIFLPSPQNSLMPTSQERVGDPVGDSGTNGNPNQNPIVDQNNGDMTSLTSKGEVTPEKKDTSTSLKNTPTYASILKRGI